MTNAQKEKPERTIVSKIEMKMQSYIVPVQYEHHTAHLVPIYNTIVYKNKSIIILPLIWLHSWWYKTPACHKMWILLGNLFSLLLDSCHNICYKNKKTKTTK